MELFRISKELCPRRRRRRKRREKRSLPESLMEMSKHSAGRTGKDLTHTFIIVSFSILLVLVDG